MNKQAITKIYDQVKYGTSEDFDEYQNHNHQRYLPTNKKRQLSPEEQESVDRALEDNWTGSVFPNYGTPASDTLANPKKSALISAILSGLAGAAVGGVVGGGPIGTHGKSSSKGALIGAALGGAGGAGLGGLLGYHGQKSDNSAILDLMRRTREENPTLRDLHSDPVYQRDRDREEARNNAMIRAGMYGY